MIGLNCPSLQNLRKRIPYDGGCSHRSNQNGIMLPTVYNYAGNGAKILCELIIIRTILNKNQYLALICTLIFFHLNTTKLLFRDMWQNLI